VTTVLLVRHGLTATTGHVLTGWTPGIPLDARTGLLAMLEVVKEDMAVLEAAGNYFDERTNRQAS
jgi:hypothetical protein